MRRRWKTKKLFELCGIGIGKTPSRADKRFWDIRKTTSNVWLSIADLLNTKDGVVSDSKEYLTDAGAALCKLVRQGTLLLSFKLTLGRLAIAGRDLYTNEAIAALTIRNHREISTDFLRYFLLYFDWDEATEGDVKLKGKTLNKAKLKEIEVSFPELDEQQRIVATLDQALDAIAIAKQDTEKNQLNAVALFDRCLNDALASEHDKWREVLLADICDIRSALVDPRRGEYVNLLHVGGANIVSKTGDLIELKTAKEEKLISGKFLFDDSMILYSKIRPYLMKVARPTFTGLCSADIYPLSPNERLLTRDFLFYVLLSRRFTDFAELGSARAGMPKVNREHLFSYRLRIPSLPEQERIATRLDSLRCECSRLEGNLASKSAALKRLQASTLEAAFNGCADRSAT